MRKEVVNEWKRGLGRINEAINIFPWSQRRKSLSLIH